MLHRVNILKVIIQYLYRDTNHMKFSSRKRFNNYN